MTRVAQEAYSAPIPALPGSGLNAAGLEPAPASGSRHGRPTLDIITCGRLAQLGERGDSTAR